MTVFYSTLISTFILSLLVKMNDYKYKELNKIIIFFIMAIFILVAGLRLNIGDTSMYSHYYTTLGTLNSINEVSKDKGFTYFLLFLYGYSQDPQFMIFTTSLITQACIIYGLAKYRSYFELEVYMYITCGIFLVTMNGMRQALAGAIMFSCTKMIEKGKFIPYVIVVIISSTIHTSALIMIPLYFIVRKEVWSKETMMIIIISSLAFIFFNELMPTFFNALQGTSYTEYEAFMGEEGVGSSFTRVLVNAVPVVLAYIKRKKIHEIWPNSKVFINFSIINLIFITFAMYNWIFARFQIYFQYYNIVLIPFVIKNCFERKERDLIYFLFIVFYFGFFYYEQVIGGVGLGYISNYFKL